MPSKLFSRIIFFLPLLLLSFTGSAHTGSIKGVAYDSTKKPLEGVSIYIKGANSSGLTDAFGHYFIKGLPAGRFRMYVSHIGYETTDQEVTIEDGVTTELNITLSSMPATLSNVTINAKRDLTLTAISGLDLKLRPVNNTQDLLRLVPGLFTAQHQGGGKAEQIFLRGFDCDHGTDINISVDGMPVNLVSHAHGQGFADSHFIIPEAIKEVDYGKGPYQVDKGNLATSGWVGFRTLNSLDKSFVKLEGGSFEFLRAVVGLNLLDRASGNGHQDAYIMGEYHYFNGPFDQSENFNRINLMGKYTNYLAPNKILSLTLSGFHSTWDASGQIPTRAVDSGYVGRYGDLDPEGGITGRVNANLQYFQSIGENAYFKSNLYASYYQFRLYSDFTFFAMDSVNGDQIRQAEKRVFGGYNSEYGNSYTAFGLKMKTQAGLGFRYDDIMNDELSHTIDRSTTLNNIALGDVHETNLFAYAQQTVNILPQFVFTAALRYDQFIQNYDNKLMQPTDVHDTTFHPHAFSPKLGLYYNFGNNARVYYNFGVGFHSNDTRTIALSAQTTGLNQYGISPVKYILPLAVSQDLGFIVKPYKNLLLQAAIWSVDLQQEFTYDGDVDNVSPTGRTRRYGFDVSLRYELTKWLYIDADFNYAHARLRDSAKENNYLELSAPFTSIGGITVRPARSVSASLRYRHISDRPANQDYSVTAPGYTVFDFVVNYIRPRYEFGMQIQNLFNVKWNEASFATTTRLREEVAMHTNVAGIEDLCYTPGVPFFLKLSATYKF